MLLLIPFTRLELKTYLDAENARQRLAAEVEPRSVFSRSLWRRDHRFFAGKVEENGRFQINRIIHYRNSFQPYIYGEIVNELDTTRIKLRLHPHPVVMILMPIFLGVFFFTFVGAAFFSGDLAQNLWIAWPALGFLIFFYIIIVGFFNFEANKARQKLGEIFQVKQDFLS
jgi:hypothetical protein